MTMNYRDDHILVAASEFQPGTWTGSTGSCHAELGRPLRDPGASSAAVTQGGLIPIPVDGADPLAIRDAVAAHVQPGGAELPALILDHTSDAGTTDEGTIFAAGEEERPRDRRLAPGPGGRDATCPAWSPSGDHRRDRPAGQRRAPARLAARRAAARRSSSTPSASSTGPAPLPPTGRSRPSSLTYRQPLRATPRSSPGSSAWRHPGAGPVHARDEQRRQGRRQRRCSPPRSTWLADNACHVPVDIVLMAFGAPG